MNNRNSPYRRRCPQSKPMPRQTVNVPDGVQTLAMVYSISQRWRGIDTTDCGFCRGTIFDELDKPFYGDRCNRNCR